MKLYKKAAWKNTSSRVVKKKHSIFNASKIVNYFPQRPENATVMVHLKMYTSKFKGCYP
jgi:hypothetical protein